MLPIRATKVGLHDSRHGVHHDDEAIPRTAVSNAFRAILEMLSGPRGDSYNPQ